MSAMSSLHLLLLLLPLLASSSAQATICSNTACIKGKEEKDGYNKMDLPPTEDNAPVQVNTTLQLINIFSVDHEAFTFTIGLVMRFKWFDNRIALNKSIEHLNTAFLEKIWLPHVYIYNSRSALEKSGNAHCFMKSSMAVPYEKTHSKYVSARQHVSQFLTELRFHCPRSSNL